VQILNRLEDFSHHDTVLVKGLRLDASIGVFDWEKQIKQTLVFDAQLFCDFTQSARSDAIEDAVDYAAVCVAIERILSQRHYQLLEFLAEHLCQQLLANFALSAVSLAIYKPGAVTNTEYVGVRIFRTNSQAPSPLRHYELPEQKDGA
jgi:dihydroneopterin aldolase